MIVIPAIDIKGCKCVRLKQGRADEETVFGDDPVAMAAHWVAEGAERLHVVDLDGAFDGTPKNQALISDIARSQPQLTIELGGGIRSPEIIDAYLEAGVRYVIIGTRAVEEPEFVGEMCRRFPGHVMVGLDALHGKVATRGWTEVTDIPVKSLALLFEGDGIDGIIYTDIGKDGMMGGVNLRATVALADAISTPVVASGGVTDIRDIEALLDVEPRVNGGITGVITGRAIYEGTLDLAEAIAATRNS
jgi:phosphoribosylformimino-5-aminoimidazole carboxamide ribotide isomerase